MVRAPKNYTELALYFQKSMLAMIHTNYTYVISDDFDLMLSLQKKSSEEKRAKYPDIRTHRHKEIDRVNLPTPNQYLKRSYNTRKYYL